MAQLYAQAGPAFESVAEVERRVKFEGSAKIAYFPYEILVNGNEVEALHMRFRMAVHFPDLNMMGDHGFMKLMASPKATEQALRGLVAAP